MKLIDKSAIVAEIEKLKGLLLKGACASQISMQANCKEEAYNEILSFLDTLEVKDPYEQCIQYSSIKDGIEAHAEVYSFNIESELFNQLTKEQQALWRKEIEQACISGGDAGYLLAKDPRYKENLEVKEVDLEKEFDKCCENYTFDDEWDVYIARHFFKLGFQKAQKGE